MLKATLAQKFEKISSLCQELNIPLYHSTAGFFAWFDLRCALESQTWEAEAALQDKLVSKKVVMLEGKVYSAGSPGFFRMVHTYPPWEFVERALRVIATLLEGKVNTRPCLSHIDRMALIDKALLTEATLPYLGHEAHREIMRRGTPNPTRG